MAPTCSACRLPPLLREQLAQRGRRGIPLRTIAQWLTEQGETVHRDAVHRHLRNCVAPTDEYDPDPNISADPAGLLIAYAARDVLEHWPSIATRLVERLFSDGAVQAAGIVASAVPETIRPQVPPTSTKE